MSKRKIDAIVIHHSASHWGDGAEIVRWHTSPKPKGNGWKYPGYHVVIGNWYPNYISYAHGKPVPHADGKVYRILSEDEVANGCYGANAHSLHVCLIGNFDVELPTNAQYLKLWDIVKFWCEKYSLDLSDVWGHREMVQRLMNAGKPNAGPKSCPGKYFGGVELVGPVSNKLLRKVAQIEARRKTFVKFESADTEQG